MGPLLFLIGTFLFCMLLVYLDHLTCRYPEKEMWLRLKIYSIFWHWLWGFTFWFGGWLVFMNIFPDTIDAIAVWVKGHRDNNLDRYYKLREELCKTAK